VRIESLTVHRFDVEGDAFRSVLIVFFTEDSRVSSVERVVLIGERRELLSWIFVSPVRDARR